MTITLTQEQKAWIDAHVARGDYASVEDAARSLIDMAIMDLQPLDDDPAWSEPMVADAMAQVDRGAVVKLDEHRRRVAARPGRPSSD